MQSTQLRSNIDLKKIPANLAYEHKRMQELVKRHESNPADPDYIEVKDSFSKLDKAIKILQAETDLEKIATIEKNIINSLQLGLQEASKGLKEIVDSIKSDKNIELKALIDESNALMQEANQRLTTTSPPTQPQRCERELLDKIEEKRIAIRDCLNSTNPEFFKKKFAALFDKLQEESFKAEAAYEEQAEKILKKLIDHLTVMDNMMGSVFQVPALFIPYFRLRKKIEKQNTTRNDALLDYRDNLNVRLEKLTKAVVVTAKPVTVVPTFQLDVKTEVVEDKEEMSAGAKDKIERLQNQIRIYHMACTWMEQTQYTVNPLDAYKMAVAFVSNNTRKKYRRRVQRNVAALDGMVNLIQQCEAQFAHRIKALPLSALEKMEKQYRVTASFYFDIYEKNEETNEAIADKFEDALGAEDKIEEVQKKLLLNDFNFLFCADEKSIDDALVESIVTKKPKSIIVKQKNGEVYAYYFKDGFKSQPIDLSAHSISMASLPFPAIDREKFFGCPASESPVMKTLLHACGPAPVEIVEQKVEDVKLTNSLEQLSDIQSIVAKRRAKIEIGNAAVALEVKKTDVNEVNALDVLSEMIVKQYNLLKAENPRQASEQSGQLLKYIKSFLMSEIYKDPVQGLPSLTREADDKPVSLEMIFSLCHASIKQELLDWLTQEFLKIKELRSQQKKNMSDYDEWLKQLSHYEITFPGIREWYGNINQNQIDTNMAQMVDGYAEAHVSWEKFRECALNGMRDSHFKILGCMRMFPAIFNGKPVQFSSESLSEREQLKQAGIVILWSHKMDAPMMMVRQGNEWIRAMLAFGVSREEYQKLYDEITLPLTDKPLHPTEYKLKEESLVLDANDLDKNNQEAIDYTLNNTLSDCVFDLIPEDGFLLQHTRETEAFLDSIIVNLVNRQATPSDVCKYNQREMTLGGTKVQQTGDRIAVGAFGTYPCFQYISDQPDNKGDQDLTRLYILSSFSEPLNTRKRSAVISLCRPALDKDKKIDERKELNEAFLADHLARTANFSAITPRLEASAKQLLSKGDSRYELDSTIPFANQEIWAIATSIVHYDAELKRTFLLKMTMPLNPKALGFDVKADSVCYPKINEWAYKQFQKIKNQTIKIKDKNGKEIEINRFRAQLNDLMAREKAKLAEQAELEAKANPFRGKSYEKMITPMMGVLNLLSLKNVLIDLSKKLQEKIQQDSDNNAKAQPDYAQMLEQYIKGLTLPLNILKAFKEDKKISELNKTAFDPLNYLWTAVRLEQASVGMQLSQRLQEFSANAMTAADFASAFNSLPTFGVFTQSTSELQNTVQWIDQELEAKGKHADAFAQLKEMMKVYSQAADKSLMPHFLESFRLLRLINGVSKAKQDKPEYKANLSQFEEALNKFYDHSFFNNENWMQQIGLQPLPKPIVGASGMHEDYLCVANELLNNQNNAKLARLYLFIRAVLKPYLPGAGKSFLDLFKIFGDDKVKLLENLNATYEEATTSIQKTIDAGDKLDQGDAKRVDGAAHSARLFSQRVRVGNDTVTVSPEKKDSNGNIVLDISVDSSTDAGVLDLSESMSDNSLLDLSDNTAVVNPLPLADSKETVSALPLTETPVATSAVSIPDQKESNAVEGIELPMSTGSDLYTPWNPSVSQAQTLFATTGGAKYRPRGERTKQLLSYTRRVYRS